MTQPISRVGVVGCGLMGAGIAEVCAKTGYTVIVREVNRESDGSRDRPHPRLDGPGSDQGQIGRQRPGRRSRPHHRRRPISMRSTPAT